MWRQHRRGDYWLQKNLRKESSGILSSLGNSGLASTEFMILLFNPKIITRENDLPKCKTVEIMYKTVDQKYTKFLLTLDRKYCTKMIGIYTGHSLVVEHLLYTCPAPSWLHYRHLAASRYETLEAIEPVEIGVKRRHPKEWLLLLQNWSMRVLLAY